MHAHLRRRPSLFSLPFLRVIPVALAMPLLGACASAGPADGADGNDDAIEDSAAEEMAREALTSATPGCPTAREGKLSVFFTTTQRHYASVVWSNDGTELLVTELAYEAKKNFFTGYEDARKYCHRLSLFSADGRKLRDVTPFVPNFVAGDPDSLVDMKGAGYMIVQSQDLTKPGSPFMAHRVTRDGGRTLLASGACNQPRVIPSPDGSRMAVVTPKANCEGASSPFGGSEFSVAFLDAAGTPRGAVTDLAFASWGTPVWTSEGAFLMTDGTTAYRVDASGAAESVAVPRCTLPATTSGEVAADGRVAGLNDKGLPAVIGTDTTRVFGCR